MRVICKIGTCLYKTCSSQHFHNITMIKELLKHWNLEYNKSCQHVQDPLNIVLNIRTIYGDCIDKYVLPVMSISLVKLSSML